MKHVIDIPEEIERALEERASASGDNVVHLIQMAVVTFVHAEVQSPLVGRRPDLPADSIEAVAPRDLPRTAPHLIAIQKRASRNIDPIADPA